MVGSLRTTAESGIDDDSSDASATQCNLTSFSCKGASMQPIEIEEKQENINRLLW